MPLGVLNLMFCATRPFLFLMYKIIQRILLHLTLKVISKGLGLAVTVCGTKGVLPHSKRRLAPAMGQDAHSNRKNNRVISAVYCIVLWFYYHFIIERYEHYIKRTNIPI